jgi:single-strand DNA-binding protein
MSASYNKCIIAGNIVRDVELRYTPKGTAVAKIGIAVNRKYKSETGETKEEVCFVDVDAWGKQAETIAQYCKKGSPILIEGRLKTESWEDKQTGAKRSKLGVTMETFQFLSGASKAESSPQTASTPKSSAEPSDPEKDDVPF